jgi:3'(2'), 5'-bisphosphate nucleotidase
MLDKIIEIARQAGEKILEIYKSENFEINFKDDMSPVTMADLDSNNIITRGLKQVSGFPVVSEEAAVEYAARKNWRRFWLVDPLDGTKDFIAKNDQFTVNIALIDGDTPVFGVIYIPASNEMYWAENGGGAYKIGLKIYNS